MKILAFIEALEAAKVSPEQIILAIKEHHILLNEANRQRVKKCRENKETVMNNDDVMQNSLQEDENGEMFIKNKETVIQRTLHGTVYDLTYLLPKENNKINKATRFTLQTIPEKWKVYCNGKYSKLDAEEIFDEFRDYWISVPGRKGFKLDWEATWRTWLRRQKPRESSHADESERPTWY